MPPPDPCFGCLHSGACCTQGLVNQLALWEWLEERGFACTDKELKFYHGIEGVFA